MILCSMGEAIKVNEHETWKREQPHAVTQEMLIPNCLFSYQKIPRYLFGGGQECFTGHSQPELFCVGGDLACCTLSHTAQPMHMEPGNRAYTGALYCMYTDNWEILQLKTPTSYFRAFTHAKCLKLC